MDSIQSFAGTLRRDRAAFFDARCREIRPRAYSHARSLTGNGADAEDLVQTTIVKAWLRFEAFDSERSFVTWFYTIMRHAFVDLCRARGRRVHAIGWSDVGLGDSEESEFDVPDPQTMAFGEGAPRISQAEIEQALMRLPESHRRIVILCDLLEHDYAHCAELEGVPVGTVRSRLSRARRRLRQILGDERLVGAV